MKEVSLEAKLKEKISVILLKEHTKQLKAILSMK